jgi:hypothetical protein
MVKSKGMFKENFLSRYKKALNIFNSKFVFHMSVIIEEILKETRPISIYLIGSFGRNEGSLYLSGGVLSPLNDYDVLMVVDKHVKNHIIDRIRRNIHNRLGLLDPFSRAFKFKGFTVWITQVTLKDINALSLLKLFELKKASKRLWGKDVRDAINIRFEDLSKYNGILILFGEIEGLLGHLDMDAVRQKKNPKETIELIYECMKVYTAIGTCLSLLAKIYEPSFLRRCMKLSKNFDVLFPELKQMSSTLPSLMVTYAYKRLLVEDDFLINQDLGKLLTRTLNDLKIIIWYYLRNAYEVNNALLPTSTHILDEYIKKLNTRVLEDLFDYYIKRRLGFSSKILRELAIRLYLRYALLKFFIRGRKKGYRIKPRVLFMCNENIMMKLWSAGLSLLESVKEDFNINESALNTVASKLYKVIDYSYIEKAFPNETPESLFSRLKRMTLDLLDIADRIFHRKD